MGEDCSLLKLGQAIGKGGTWQWLGAPWQSHGDGLDVEGGKGMQQALASLETVTLADRLGRDVGRQEAFVMG